MLYRSCKVEGFAGLDFLGGRTRARPVVVAIGVGERLGEEDFDVAGGCGGVVLRGEAGAGGEEARGEDAGVVEDEEVAGLEELREVGEVVGLRRRRSARSSAEHAAGAADRGRVLRDEVFGEIEMEVGDEHGGKSVEVRV